MVQPTKQFISCLILLFIAISFSGCTGSCTNGSGNKVSEEREVPSFTGVSLIGNGNINIIQDGTSKLKLAADDNLLGEIDSYVQDDVLYVKPGQCFTGSLEVYVNMKTVRYVSLNGSGNIVGGTQIISDDLKIEQTGSGKILAGIQAKKLSVAMSGSGDSTIIGTADDFSYESSGSGKLSAYKLKAKKGKISLAGSGTVETTAQETLDITISGSGTVSYKGDAALTETISGSGKIVKAA